MTRQGPPESLASPSPSERCRLIDVIRSTPNARRGPRGASALAAAVALVSLTALVRADEPSETLSRPIETDPARAASAAEERGGEVLRLHWKLAGFLGALVGLFVPNEGDALLTFVPDQEDRTEIQILVTAPRRSGEYFLYGAAIDVTTGTTERVWDSYVFRDRRKDREQEIRESEIIDYASAVYRLRWNPPSDAARMTIWNHGDTYPVEVEPLDAETRKIQGKKTQVRGYVIHGVEVDGKRSFDDKFFVYFARDEHSTPVEIAGKRGLIRVRIQLVDATGKPARPPALDRAERAGEE